MLFNAAAEQMFRCMAAEAVGQPLERFIPARFRSVHREYILSLGDTYLTKRRMGQLGTVSGLRSDGEEFPLEASISQIEVDGKRYYTVIHRDITERMRAEETLRASEERFSKAFNASPSAMVISRLRDGKIIDANELWLRYRSLRREELVGRTAAELGIWTDPEVLAQILNLIQETGSVRNIELNFSSLPGGERVELVSAELIELNHEHCVLWVFQDITEKKKLEEQFRQALKMEAIGRLAGGVAHDFNNLLTAILGYCNLMQLSLNSKDPFYRELEEIRKAGERATGLTKQLLAFSRKQVLSPKIIDLNRTVTDLNRMLQRLIGEDVELVTRLHPELGLVKADPGQIEQGVMNLVINARDPMPRGGRLTLSTANEDLDEVFTQTHLGIQSGSYVLLEVCDTGHGIDAQTRSHIFEPFFTTREPGRGTGLGLATVYGIVQQSGGGIWVESELEHGTTFRIYLPRVNEVEQPALVPSPLQQLPGGSETILLVEDEEIVRGFASETLRRRGYQVLEASNGQEALRMCEPQGSAIHLVITDIVMPKMSGRELAERLAVVRPELKILFISGYIDDSLFQHGLVEARALFLQKPFTPESLLRKVRDILDEFEGSQGRVAE